MTGRDDELYGQLSLDWGDLQAGEGAEIALELEADQTLLVQVLDSLGQPAIDVPLGIRPRQVTGDDPYYAELARSGPPDGLARLAHLQLQKQSWRQKGNDGAEYVLLARIPGMTEAGPSFDADDLPEDPIVLRLPPTGSIVLRTTDAEGGALPTEYGYIRLAIAPAQTQKDLASYIPPQGQQWSELPEDDGRFVYRWVVAASAFSRSQA